MWCSIKDYRRFILSWSLCFKFNCQPSSSMAFLCFFHASLNFHSSSKAWMWLHWSSLPTLDQAAFFISPQQLLTIHSSLVNILSAWCIAKLHLEQFSFFISTKSSIEIAWMIPDAEAGQRVEDEWGGSWYDWDEACSADDGPDSAAVAPRVDVVLLLHQGLWLVLLLDSAAVGLGVVDSAAFGLGDNAAVGLGGGVRVVLLLGQGVQILPLLHQGACIVLRLEQGGFDW